MKMYWFHVRILSFLVNLMYEEENLPNGIWGNFISIHESRRLKQSWYSCGPRQWPEGNQERLAVLAEEPQVPYPFIAPSRLYFLPHVKGWCSDQCWKGPSWEWVWWELLIQPEQWDPGKCTISSLNDIWVPGIWLYSIEPAIKVNIGQLSWDFKNLGHF